MAIEEEIKQTKFRSAQHKVVLNLFYTSSWLQGKQQDFFKAFGITSSQFNILRILRGQHPKKICGVEIKSRMLDRNSDIPRLLDRLLIKKLIIKSRSKDDRRAANVMITPAGLKLLKKIDPHVHEAEQQLIKLSEKEATQLSKLLDKVRG